MATWNSNKGKRSPGLSNLIPRPATMSANLTHAHFAQKAIEVLMDAGGFIDCTKAQFALKMGWTNPGPNGIDLPDRRLVDAVCNLTRDQEQWEPIRDSLGGYVIAYSPSRGGMLLIDPTGEIPLQHMIQLLLGDLQKQSAIKTINRRRTPTWRAAGEGAVQTGDTELARLLWQAEGEINKTGFVSDLSVTEIYKASRSRGLLGVTE